MNNIITRGIPDVSTKGAGVLRFGLDGAVPLESQNPNPLKGNFNRKRFPSLLGIFFKYRPIFVENMTQV